MANTRIEYQEIRFDVRDPQLTHVYVYVANLSNDGVPVEGWRHKVFPADVSTLDIMLAWNNGEEEPVLWDRGAPTS